MAPYPLSTDEGAISHLGTGAQDKCILALGRQPAATIRGFSVETPQFKMLEKYDVMNMETRDQGLDDGLWELVMDTYYESPGYIKQVQGDYYSAEGYGTWANGIQQALFQSIAPTPTGHDVIRVFPAWPGEWDAKFKLLGKGGFLVSSAMVNGDIHYVEIESQLGGTCRIRNPWNTNITLYRNGLKAETIAAKENDLVKFETNKGEDIVIVREGKSPDMYRTTEVK